MILALLLVPWSAHARTIQVPGEVPTVQGAINAAVNRDTVLVAPGTYLENLVLSKTITLASHYHATGDSSYIGQRILDGRAGPYVISVAGSVGPATIIVGFTFRNGGDGVATVGGGFNFLNTQNGTNYQTSNVDGSTAILRDLMFDATYQLQPGSPAIDAGVDGTAPDLGAYETEGTTVPAPLVANAGPDRTGREGAGVSFTGSASGGTGPYSFAWQFGDGRTGTGATATHVYADNVTVVATLTVTDATGATATDTAAVTISNAAPTASAGGPYTGASGSPVAFSGSAMDPSPADTTVGLQWLWDFGDGMTGTGSAPTHTYEVAGTYTVRLTVTDKDGGLGSATTTATVSSAPPLGPVRAFPGAEGFGANAVGGRGGRVIEVTNLNDSGPGSLRAAIAASGPRIVVFRVGGTIEVSTTMSITNPFITIAGQTAPGGGIALKNRPNNTGPPITIDTSEVIIRHLRLRPGPSTALSANVDGLTIRAGSNIVIDHCSFSWAVDEVLNTWYSPTNVTIQWSIFSEALHRSTHAKGPHSKGVLIGSAGAHSISFHHNLLAHNKNRTPGIKTTRLGTIDVVNNVVYNWGTGGDGAGSFVDEYGKIPLNYVRNYFKKGADSGFFYELGYFNVSGQGGTLYVEGNIGPNRTSETQPDFDAVDPAARPYMVTTRNPAPPVTTTSALGAYYRVLAEAGATLPTRDPVDARIVNDVRNRAGRIIDHPGQVGGWPVLAAGTPSVDTDQDGMPDAWESARGLDPMRDDSAGDRDGDGYTNIEEYLNSLTSVADVADSVLPGDTGNRLFATFSSAMMVIFFVLIR